MNEVLIKPTENPDVLKFVTEYNIVKENMEFTRASDLSQIPIIQEIFEIPYIEKIILGENYFAISKEKNATWENKPEELRAIIQDLLLAYPNIFVQKKKEQYSIYIEMTPNPNIMKFVANRRLAEETLEIKRGETENTFPLSEAIFKNLDFVENIFIENNFLALTRNRKALWGDVMHQTRDFISTYLQEGNPILAQNNKSAIAEIEEAIRDYILTDSGERENIKVVEYNDEQKKVKIQLIGWGDCISCLASVRSGIEAILKNKLPHLIETVETNE